jgi:hypothetical protein
LVSEDVDCYSTAVQHGCRWRKTACYISSMLRLPCCRLVLFVGPTWQNHNLHCHSHRAY